MLHRFWREHPLLSLWLALSYGMALLTMWFGQDAGLQPRQVFILIGVSVILAAACVWILNWEARVEPEVDAESKASGSAAPQGRIVPDHRRRRT